AAAFKRHFCRGAERYCCVGSDGAEGLRFNEHLHRPDPRLSCGNRTGLYERPGLTPGVVSRIKKPESVCQVPAFLLFDNDKLVNSDSSGGQCPLLKSSAAFLLCRIHPAPARQALRCRYLPIPEPPAEARECGNYHRYAQPVLK